MLSRDRHDFTSQRTPELSDAGGPACPHWQLAWPARVRSSDFVGLWVFHSATRSSPCSRSNLVQVAASLSYQATSMLPART